MTLMKRDEEEGTVRGTKRREPWERRRGENRGSDEEERTVGATNPFTDDLLAGKVTLITGGGTGLGLAMAEAFAAAGASVVVASRNPDHVEPAAARLRDDAREAIERAVPMGRFATADEVATAALYLASDAAAYITGIVLPIDGGLTLSKLLFDERFEALLRRAN